MKTNMQRREALTKAAIVAGSLLAFKTQAAPVSKNISFAGGWFYLGQPCAIFREGSILLAVNEVGSLATALVTSPNTLLIWGGGGWDSGLTATLENRGHIITWSNGTVWTKSQF